MSIEIDIIPKHSTPLVVKELMDQIERQPLIGGVDLGVKVYGSSSPLDSRDSFLVGEHYQLTGIEENTISLILEEIDKDDEGYEIEMLEDFGRNLRKDEIIELSESWSEAGYTFKLISYGARSKNELQYMKLIGELIARALDGVIMIKENVMNLPIGVYCVDEFSKGEFII